jgi:hypothetical protein
MIKLPHASMRACAAPGSRTSLIPHPRALLCRRLQTAPQAANGPATSCTCPAGDTGGAQNGGRKGGRQGLRAKAGRSFQQRGQAGANAGSLGRAVAAAH